MRGESPRRPHTLIKLPSDVNEELARRSYAKNVGRGHDDGQSVDTVAG